MKTIKILIIALFSLLAPSAFGQARIVADVIYSGGFPLPNRPLSWGSTVYADGKVVIYENYSDRTVVKVGAYLTAIQIDKLLKAGSDLEVETLVRDDNTPQCMDAPYIRYLIVNKANEMVPIADSRNCVEGHRSDYGGYTEGLFLKALDQVVNYGFQ